MPTPVRPTFPDSPVRLILPDSRVDLRRQTDERSSFSTEEKIVAADIFLKRLAVDSPRLNSKNYDLKHLDTTLSDWVTSFRGRSKFMIHVGVVAPVQNLVHSVSYYVQLHVTNVVDTEPDGTVTDSTVLFTALHAPFLSSTAILKNPSAPWSVTEVLRSGRSSFVSAESVDYMVRPRRKWDSFIPGVLVTVVEALTTTHPTSGAGDKGILP